MDGQQHAPSDWRDALLAVDPGARTRRADADAALRLRALGRHRDAVACWDELLARSPDDVAAHRALALLLRQLGDRRGADAHLRAAHAVEVARTGVPSAAREDVVRFRMDADAGASPERAPAAYVAAHFDGYAPGYDEHLLDKLAYRAPERLRETLESLYATRSDPLDVLELGCGTGLVGVALRPFAARLDGVDLSPNMLALAREKLVYDALREAELVEALRSCERRYDLVVASDVLPYVGDLAPVFAACREALADGGLFVFSVETCDDDDPAADVGYRLRATRRFVHRAGYVRGCAAAYDFTVVSSDDRPLRDEGGVGVPMLLCAARKDAGG